MNLSFRRLGLQRRIMLYVTLGLAAMFGFLVFLGLGAIDQASRLVFEERLSTAYTTAGIIERDFGRIATDVREASRMEAMASGSDAPGPEAAALLFDHMTRTEDRKSTRLNSSHITISYAV